VPSSRLPDYEPLLAAYHHAFAPELATMIASLPLCDGDQVLELACGDGAYTPWLAARVGPTGAVVGLDIDPAYLEVARQVVAREGLADTVRLVGGALERLPFADGAFDAAWCAQSLFSLPEPIDAVRRMARVVKPNGLVAVLETDTLHQVLLPWPVDLELAVRAAEWRAFVEESAHPRKFYVGRGLVGVFREAGLTEVEARTFASDRQAPLGPAERAFLEHYLADLLERVAPRLKPGDRKTFRRLAEPDSPEFLANRPDIVMTCVDRLVWGRKR
jgi:ubiquinone/menaquinone biosynthesis C-methylase UbiE